MIFVIIMVNSALYKISKEEKKRITSLYQKKFRVEKKKFIVEGRKPVLEALTMIPNDVELIYCTSEVADNYQSNLNKFDVKVVHEKDFNSISNLKNPQGILAIANFINVKSKDEGLTLVLDNVQDPGNFGTIIRSADWYGVKEIICSKTCVDLYNPKTIQATMGSAFRVKISYLDLEDYLDSTQLPIYGALLEGENIYKEALNQDGILVMGNEGNGISKEIIRRVTQPITIPKIGGGESLNVSIATAILLSEFKRRTF